MVITNRGRISVSVAAGTYKVITNAINVRKAPSKTAEITGTYMQDNIVKLDNWSTVADGYVWGRYTDFNTHQLRYVAVRATNGINYLEKL